MPIWKMNFCSRFLRLSVAPRCRERPQMPPRCRPPKCNVRWLIYIINSVDKTKFLFTTSSPTQHPSFFRNYPLLALMSRNAHDDKNGRFGERAARLTILAKLAILAIFCQFCQISSSTGIDTTWVNIGNFGEFGKFGNFGDILPISSNWFIHWY